MENKAEKFWNDFLKIKDDLMDIDSLNEEKSEQLLLKLDGKLKQYSQGIDFILGDISEHGRTLTLTANGDEDFFDDVITLAENAPVMDFWNICTFMPAEGKNQTMESDGVKLSSDNLYFLPMESNDLNDKIGLKIAGKNLINNDDNMNCAYLLCEKMIGEYNCAVMIRYFEITELPSDYEKKGFLPLNYLPDFTEWKIERNKA
ncbi:MAG: hypothetical protein IJ250_05880 [Bacteroidales bacterium]|nr:hypothetical protein [Bacteroidales bacterium]